MALRTQRDIHVRVSQFKFKGAQYGIGPSSHYEVIPVNGAGGAR